MIEIPTYPIKETVRGYLQCLYNFELFVPGSILFSTLPIPAPAVVAPAAENTRFTEDGDGRIFCICDKTSLMVTSYYKCVRVNLIVVCYDDDKQMAY